MSPWFAKIAEDKMNQCNFFSRLDPDSTPSDGKEY